ncbi:MAG: sigma 54-interacting transcriptional regulator [Candidatus Latescibacteria bacterium]|nr:sigma 54-interacting transcriptional regulator [Candidatus Latescibacterota bacterium]
MPNDANSIILDSISDGVFTVDDRWLITYFNRAAEDITGIQRGDAIGQPCNYVFRASICESGCALRRTMETGERIQNLPIFIIRGDGVKIPVSISTALLKDEDGTVVGGVETFHDISIEEELKRELKHSYTFADIISRNHRMHEIFSLLPAVAESTSSVLVQGESGTGKELICRAIHNISPRADKPFVAINCGALPDTLLESELFGYKAGAFTDAGRDKKGHFARAEGGTILLDEIGDISSALQVKLLRILQEKEYLPLGAEHPEKADVRILAATNRDLKAMMEAGDFRTDLYYRINVVSLTVPPLRDRKEDIPLLVEHFIGHFNRIAGRKIEGISDAAMASLMNYDYPGNIRELENAVEHAFVVCRANRILKNHLPDQFQIESTRAASETGGETLRDIEIAAIQETLRRCGYNRTKAARALGIHKTTLHRKIRSYNLELPEKDGRSGGA